MLGVRIQEVTSAIADKEKVSNVSGAYIASVNQGGAAEEAGLRPKDIITKINGLEILSPADLQETISEHRPGDKINVTYSRNGKENTVSVELKNIDGNTAVVLESSGESVLGCTVVPVTSQDRKKYDIESGVRVTNVGDGKLKDIGIRKGTLITTINDKNVNNASEIRDATSDGENLAAIEGIQPNGTYFAFQFRN